MCRRQRLGKESILKSEHNSPSGKNIDVHNAHHMDVSICSLLPQMILRVKKLTKNKNRLDILCLTLVKQFVRDTDLQMLLKTGSQLNKLPLSARSIL